MKFTKEKSNRWIVMLTVCFLFCLSSVYATAKEVRYPVPCYEGEELAKVREWEKQWVGKTIDHTNVDQVKEFLPESLYAVYKDTDKWGTNTFDIAPYKQLKPPQGQIDWTLKGAGKPSVDEDDAMHDFVAGTPFPNPKAGAELMYNYECRAVWDERKQMMDRMYVYDHRRKNVRSFAADVPILQTAERTSIPPTPELPNNPRGIRMATIVAYLAPNELKGLIVLANQYKDRTKEWDGWLWIAPIRRVRRQDTMQRQDHRGGMDFCDDDQNVWFGRVARNKYKLLGRKEQLFGRHNKIENATFTPGNFLWQNLSRERIKPYLIEVVSKDPDYMYQKSIMWVDPETWCLIYADKYDRKGRLWKINDCSQAEYTSNDGQGFFDVCTQFHADIQRQHATVAGGGFPDTSGLYPLSYFTPRNLERIGR